MVIISEKSGSQVNIRPDIESLLNATELDFKIRNAKIPPEISKLIKVERDNFKVVAVYGGDGSIIASIKALSGSQTKLLILPGGTANIVATEQGFNENAVSILDNYLKGLLLETSFDIASAGKGMLATDMHSGWWSEAIASTPSSLKSKVGFIAYGLSAIRKLPVASKSDYEIITDHRNLNFSSYALFIANHGHQNFLGIPIFRHRHEYGVIRLASINSLSPARLFLWLATKAFFNKPIGGAIKTYKSSVVTIKKSPRQYYFDDEQIKIEPNMVIRGAESEVTIFTKPTEANRIPFYSTWIRLKSFYSRYYERLRNHFLGVPNYSSSKVIPRLYVGGQYKVDAYSLFRLWGIKAVVNMRRVKDIDPPKDFYILQLKTQDWSPPSINDLSLGVKFIDRHISSGRGVYVHCRLGEGRGPSMAVAYLIYKGMTAEEAINLIRLRRPTVTINKRQRKRLVEWQDICAKSNDKKG